MKHKKILLVEDNYVDILNIKTALEKLGIEHSLMIAQNGTEALSMLMGSSSSRMENYIKTGKVRPDVILLNLTTTEKNGFEFLEVIQKYYSLKNICVYIIGSPDLSVDPETIKKYSIAGYITKPLDFDNTLSDAVSDLRNKLCSTAPGALFGIPLIGVDELRANMFGFLKTKGVASAIGHTVGSKLAVGATCAILTASIAQYPFETLTTTSSIEKEKKIENITIKTEIAKPSVPQSCDEDDLVNNPIKMDVPSREELPAVEYPKEVTLTAPVAAPAKEIIQYSTEPVAQRPEKVYRIGVTEIPDAETE